MLIVGTALYNGDGVAPDPVTAYAYVSRAAAKGLAPAQATLADMDEQMPIEQRKKGIDLAQAMAAAPKKTVAPAPPAKIAGAKMAPKAAAPKLITTKPAVAAPRAAVVTNGKWRIQLGAFGQRKSAEALFGKLSGKLAGRQAYYVPVGAIVRLQVGPYESRAAASAACATLAPQACFPVGG
jgi:hypothetical protein